MADGLEAKADGGFTIVEVDADLERGEVVCHERVPLRLAAGTWSGPQSWQHVSIDEEQMLVLMGDVVLGFGHELLDGWRN